MERIAIIDHERHILYVEDISDETLEEYGGEEEAYIEDMYSSLNDYSWDYIKESYYIKQDTDDPIDIDYANI